MTPDTLISIGRIVKSRGLDGEVVVHALSDDPDRFRDFQRVVATEKDGANSVLDMEFVRTHPRQGKIEVHVRFEGVASREDADAMRGQMLSVPREDLKLGHDEYFLFELAGLEVATSSGQTVGRVKEVRRYPGQDLIVVASDDGQESLIPDVPEFVDKSEMEKGRLIVTPIEGLLPDGS
jgi:16S rRNA processing protein RimM